MPKTHIKIASQTLGSDAASVTFSNLPQNYTDLILVVSNAMSTRTSSQDIPTFVFNSDTGANYSATELDGSGTNASSATSTRWTSISAGYGGFIPDSNSTANPSLYPGMFTAHFQSYSNGSVYKTVLSRYAHSSSNIAYNKTGMHVSLWRSLSPITSITIGLLYGPNYKSGTVFTLYGIESAKYPKAIGGDIIVSDGTYWYHAFKTSGKFIPSVSLNSDVLIVAGGGSGSGANQDQQYGAPSGGGAGGVFYATSQSLSNPCSVIIGAGGSSFPYNSSAASGANGNDSQFANLTLATGGGAGANSYGNGNTGGSAGGGGTNQVSTQSSTGGTGYGNAGGARTGYAGAGGGGAGAVGGNGVNNYQAGPGGNGTSAFSSWLAVTGLGQNVSGTYYIAGGGAGGASPNYGTPTAAVGGYGGGGTGGVGASGPYGTSGAANTGGGGGASGARASTAGSTNGNPGGSGLIIVRYPV